MNLLHPCVVMELQVECIECVRGGEGLHLGPHYVHLIPLVIELLFKLVDLLQAFGIEYLLQGLHLRVEHPDLELDVLVVLAFRFFL